MIRGLYTSALGMTTQMKRMDVITNNIANIDTTGFKKDAAVSRPFTEELMKRLDDPSDMRYANKIGRLSMGVFVDDVYTDFSNGSFRNTNSPLDVAISGDGFFVIQTTDQNGETVEKYSRDGAFTMQADGTLITKLGDRVTGQNGNIVIPLGVITISDRGDIFSDGEYVDTIRMIAFEDNHTLRKQGDNLYNTTDDSTPTAFTGRLEQGYLENSNASSVKEMVEMITTSRIYDANQRMITTHDSILNRTVNEIGKK